MLKSWSSACHTDAEILHERTTQLAVWYIYGLDDRIEVRRTNDQWLM